VDSKQRTKFSATVLRWLQDPEKERTLRNLLTSPDAIQEGHKSEVETTRRKFSIFWGSTPAWAVIGMIAGVVASQWSLKVLFVVAWGVFFGEFIRVKFFEKRTAKIIGNGLAGIILVLVFYTGWKFTPKPKEIPTLDQQINALAQKFPWLSSAPSAPAVTVNIPPTPVPPQHTYVEWEAPFQQIAANFLPYHKDERVIINFGYGNGGDFPVINPSMDAVVKLVPLSESKTVFKKYHNQLKIQSMSGVINPHSGRVLYHSYWLDEPLTEEQVKELNDQRLMLCGIGSAWWEDATGKYKTNMCECYVVGDSSWHSLDENNKEHKR
jgi:hypothetical protein